MRFTIMVLLSLLAQPSAHGREIFRCDEPDTRTSGTVSLRAVAENNGLTQIEVTRKGSKVVEKYIAQKLPSKPGTPQVYSGQNARLVISPTSKPKAKAKGQFVRGYADAPPPPLDLDCWPEPFLP